MQTRPFYKKILSAFGWRGGSKKAALETPIIPPRAPVDNGPSYYFGVRWRNLRRSRPPGLGCKGAGLIGGTAKGAARGQRPETWYKQQRAIA